MFLVTITESVTGMPMEVHRFTNFTEAERYYNKRCTELQDDEVTLACQVYSNQPDATAWQLSEVDRSV